MAILAALWGRARDVLALFIGLDWIGLGLFWSKESTITYLPTYHIPPTSTLLLPTSRSKETPAIVLVVGVRRKLGGVVSGSNPMMTWTEIQITGSKWLLIFERNKTPPSDERNDATGSNCGMVLWSTIKSYVRAHAHAHDQGTLKYFNVRAVDRWRSGSRNKPHWPSTHPHRLYDLLDETRQRKSWGCKIRRILFLRDS